MVSINKIYIIINITINNLEIFNCQISVIIIRKENHFLFAAHAEGIIVMNVLQKFQEIIIV